MNVYLGRKAEQPYRAEPGRDLPVRFEGNDSEKQSLFMLDFDKVESALNKSRCFWHEQNLRELEV
jgi:hypothetical protein